MRGKVILLITLYVIQSRGDGVVDVVDSPSGWIRVQLSNDAVKYIFVLYVYFMITVMSKAAAAQHTEWAISKEIYSVCITKYRINIKHGIIHVQS